MRRFPIILLLAFLGVLSCNTFKNFSASDSGPADDFRWLPAQKAPAGLVTTTLAANQVLEYNLVQSLCGLAAKAVNAGQLDEMIWVNRSEPSYLEWFKRMRARLKPTIRGEFGPWELVARYRDKKIIKGYILYKAPQGRGDSPDPSFNVATVLAGLKQGILVEESQEQKAKALGLTLLEDARGKRPEDVYAQVKGSLNQRFALAQSPAKSNVRDLAIAHNAMTFYGTGGISEELMAQLQPSAAILGWNAGEEFEHTILPSRWAHFNVPSDWCHNLTVLSAASEKVRLPKIKTLNPNHINWDKKGSFHSFIMSDGDNAQWMMGSFFHNPSFWANPAHGQLPFGWTACPLNLSLMAPDAYNFMVETQPDNASIIEYGGGYQYPDFFATRRPQEREALLRSFSRSVNARMKLTGCKLFGFIVDKTGSEASREAYRIYAEEIEDLTGMIAVQYAPYSGGEGQVYWVKNKKGVEIPVVTARYSLWADLRKQYRSGGNPDQIAESINADTQADPESMNWTVVHAWSRFTRQPDGSVTDGGQGPAAQGGVTPVTWTVNKLRPAVQVVSPEELIWRLRMKHNPEQTRRLLQQYPQ